MADKPATITPRTPKGFRDVFGGYVTAREEMIAAIRRVYERYGFAPLDTPAVECVDVLGKFLPEADLPDAGIFSFREAEDWLALRYDLTAPLSRVFAMYPDLPKPYRRYQVGPVWRNEETGAGRFREFYQFDFDSVGTASMAADAECCCIAADTLESLGIARGQYIVQVSHRKVLNGVLDIMARQPGKPLEAVTRLHVLRSIDKLDRIGMEGVRLLLGRGRLDPSGDFTPGVGLSPDQIDVVEQFLTIRADAGAAPARRESRTSSPQESLPASRAATCDAFAALVADSPDGRQGVDELRQIDAFLTAAGYADDRVIFDPTIVRGLAYYTGPVFEASLTMEIVDDSGQKRRFGSVFGGGRYDDLVERFTGKKVPAVGASIGVDRLLEALRVLGRVDVARVAAPVLVTTMDKPRMPEYQAMAAELRNAGINTELYVGEGGIGRQFKYANQSGKTVVIVMGEDEAKASQVSIKDMRLGDELSKEVGGDRKRWLEQQPAQMAVARGDLVNSVQAILARYNT